MIGFLKALPLIFREWSHSQRPARAQPESTTSLEPGSAEALVRQAEVESNLKSLMRFNALALTRLVPKNGVVLDLASGTGQIMLFLVKHRPDIRVICLEQSKAMLEEIRRQVHEGGLADRVTLIEGEMSRAHEQVQDRVDLVTSILSLHCLADDVAWRQFLNCLKVLRFRNNCSIWLFDWERPGHAATPDSFVEFFFGRNQDQWRRVAENSLRSAFALEELADDLDHLGVGPFEHYRSRWLPVFQIHRLRSEKHFEFTQSLWKTPREEKRDARRLGFLRWQFPGKVMH